MRRRHLVLLAGPREASVDRVGEEPIGDSSTALHTTAIQRFLDARRRAHDRLRGRGLSAFNVTPAGLPISIVNRYLDIKRSGAL